MTDLHWLWWIPIGIGAAAFLVVWGWGLYLMMSEWGGFHPDQVAKEEAAENQARRDRHIRIMAERRKAGDAFTVVAGGLPGWAWISGRVGMNRWLHTGGRLTLTADPNNAYMFPYEVGATDAALELVKGGGVDASVWQGDQVVRRIPEACRADLIWNTGKMITGWAGSWHGRVIQPRK